jgi:glycosyltransferase involved in cell wall biosynthesis
MVTVLFFTRNNAAALARSLAPLVHDAVEGHISEVIVFDDASDDASADIADASGCTVVRAGENSLRETVVAARADWLVVLEPGARLKHGWYDAVVEHAMRPDSAAGCFRPYTSGNWVSRILFPVTARKGPLSRGLVISKAQALANLSGEAVSGEDLIRGLALKPLKADIEMAAAR